MYFLFGHYNKQCAKKQVIMRKITLTQRNVHFSAQKSVQASADRPREADRSGVFEQKRQRYGEKRREETCTGDMRKPNHAGQVARYQRRRAEYERGDAFFFADEYSAYKSHKDKAY